MGDMLNNEGASGQVTKDLVDLRQALNEINPADESHSPVERVLNKAG